MKLLSDILMFFLFLLILLPGLLGCLWITSLVGRKVYNVSGRLTERTIVRTLFALVFAVPTFVLSPLAVRFVFEKFGLFERFGFV